MSILICGMEMPTRCTGCPFVRDIGDYTFVGCKLNVGLAVNRAFPYRHGDCPLVPVPPHGRLIDADANLSVMMRVLDAPYTSHGTIDTAMLKACIKMFEEAPTIIPAEEGE